MSSDGSELEPTSADICGERGGGDLGEENGGEGGSLLTNKSSRLSLIRRIVALVAQSTPLDSQVQGGGAVSLASC